VFLSPRLGWALEKKSFVGIVIAVEVAWGERNRARSGRSKSPCFVEFRRRPKAGAAGRAGTYDWCGYAVLVFDDEYLPYD
jgi:hypothetical protein